MGFFETSRRAYKAKGGGDSLGQPIRSRKGLGDGMYNVEGRINREINTQSYVYIYIGIEEWANFTAFQTLRFSTTIHAYP